MREEHPIDELFAQGLYHAEVTPPAGVLDAVRSHLAEKKRRTRRKKRRGAILLFLFLGLTGAGVWSLFTNGVPRTGATRGIKESRPPVPSGRPASPPGTTRTTEQQSIQGLARQSSTDANATSSLRAEKAVAPVLKTLQKELVDPVGVNTRTQPAAKAVVRSRTSPTPYAARGRTIEDADLDLGPDAGPSIMMVRTSFLQAIRSEVVPFTTQADPGYVLPHGEWFATLAAGYFALRYERNGPDDELNEARYRADHATDAFLYGMSIGRLWRNGLSLSLGLGTGGQRSHFARADRTTANEASISEHIVVFDQTVLATFPDTTSVLTIAELDRRSANRTSVWRVPLLLGWRYDLGRWHLAIQFGPAFESRRQQAGYLLVRSASDGGLQSRPVLEASPKALRTVALSGEMLGGVTFDLTERVGLGVFGSGSTDLLTWQEDERPQPHVSRFGLQLSLQYLFPAHPR